jgi:hypothetical protein
VKIREVEIELSTEIIGDILRNKHYKAEDVGSPYASFDPGALLIRAAPPKIGSNSDGFFTIQDFLTQTRQRLRTLSTKEAKLSLLLNETTWWHELSHFHDYLCTSAGILSFAYDWSATLGIYIALKELRERAWVPTDSFTKLFKEKEPHATRVINLFTNMVVTRIVRFGDFDPIPVDPSFRQYDVVWGLFDISGHKFRVPFFPAGGTANGQQFCQLICLGFRSMTECSAILRETQVLRAFGQEYVDEYYRRIGSAVEYKVANFLSTKVFANNGFGLERPDYPHGQLYRVLHGAMSRPFKNWEAGPGPLFVSELARVDEVTATYPGSQKENISQMKTVSSLVRRNCAPEYDDQFYLYVMRNAAFSAFDHAIELFENTVDDFTLPPDSIEAYDEYYRSNLTQPLLSINLNRLGMAYKEPDLKMTSQFWSTVTFILSRAMIEQGIWHGKLECPVLKGPYSEFLQYLQIHEHCKTGLTRGGCGRFKLGEDVTQHCDCMWKEIAVDIGFALERNAPFQH